MMLPTFALAFALAANTAAACSQKSPVDAASHAGGDVDRRALLARANALAQAISADYLEAFAKYRDARAAVDQILETLIDDEVNSPARELFELSTATPEIAEPFTSYLAHIDEIIRGNANTNIGRAYELTRALIDLRPQVLRMYHAASLVRPDKVTVADLVRTVYDQDVPTVVSAAMVGLVAGGIALTVLDNENAALSAGEREELAGVAAHGLYDGLRFEVAALEHFGETVGVDILPAEERLEALPVPASS